VWVSAIQDGIGDGRPWRFVLNSPKMGFWAFLSTQRFAQTRQVGPRLAFSPPDRTRIFPQRANVFGNSMLYTFSLNSCGRVSAFGTDLESSTWILQQKPLSGNTGLMESSFCVRFLFFDRLANSRDGPPLVLVLFTKLAEHQIAGLYGKLPIDGYMRIMFLRLVIIVSFPPIF